LAGGITDIGVCIHVIGAGINFPNIVEATDEGCLKSIVQLLVSVTTSGIFYES
jgi:hypothetical protein